MPSELDAGIQHCSHQIKQTLESADILIKKRKFSTAIGLIILAQEESARMRVFHIHKKNKQPITNTEWKRLSDHKTKLTLTYINSKKAMGLKSTEQVNAIYQIWSNLGLPEKINRNNVGKIDEIRINTLESLDLLKQDCFYTNYLENEKKWFSVIDDLTLEQQKAIAISQHMETKIEYHMMQIAQKFDVIQTDRLDKIKKDRHMIEVRKLHNLRIAPKYKKMIELASKTIELKFANRRAVNALNEEKKKSKKQ